MSLFNRCALLFLAAVFPLAAQVAPTSVSDFAFAPTDDEGYTQAWNVDFRGKDVFLYITYVISNTGPGTWNNGVSVLLYRGGKSRTWTAEYSDKSLKAQPGSFGHKSGTSRIGFENGKLVLHAENPGGGASPKEALEIDLTLTPAGRGIQISGGKLEPRPGTFLRADIPITAAAGQLRMTVGGVTETIAGIGGMEAIWANKSPHSYAKRFLLARTFTADQGILLGGYFGTAGTEDFLLRYAIMQKGEVKSHGSVKKIEIQDSQPDGFSGYTVPTKVRYTLSDNCTLQEERKYFSGGFDVLGSVSALLRWVLRVFFARPYVMHYDASLTYACADAKPVTVIAQTSYYLINP
ncbi:MAG: hypothetical protein JNM27_18965 [Leptospirales bacterium]|nr:hypothetical protein [Leptospirales bacterium]